MQVGFWGSLFCVAAFLGPSETTCTQFIGYVFGDYDKYYKIPQAYFKTSGNIRILKQAL